VSNYTKVSEGSETPSSLVFSKQEMLELADYLQYASECAKEYARETNERHGATFPMVQTLLGYAHRAEQYRRRVRALVP